MLQRLLENKKAIFSIQQKLLHLRVLLMKFIADVNIAKTVITSLRKKGHDVIDIKKLNRTISDTEIIKLALKENRIVLTHDKDFLALTQYPKYQVPAIVIRLYEQNARSRKGPFPCLCLK